MANSYEITKFKLDLISALINNQEIVELIYSSNIDSPEDLIGSNIYSFNRINDTEQEQKTYITLTVDVPNIRDRNNILKDVLITICVITHQDMMNENTLIGNRVDILSANIDKLFNGSSNYGFGELKLISNVESLIDKVHPCRIMKFITKDINNSVCGVG